ncbi:MAG: hypothetical protein M0Z53_01635 [Thermaerobacter sp.]|nr:hypothetical protein [Thermaerobacter sp.]
MPNLGRLYTDKSPRLVVPLLFFLSGQVALLVGLALLIGESGPLFAGSYGSMGVVAATHMFTLGFATMVMMGALYQLMPVTLNLSPLPPAAVVGQWLIYNPGVALLVAGMADGDFPLIVFGGGLTVIAVCWFLINAAWLLRQGPTWTVSGYFMVSAMGYLSLTIALGMVLTLNLRYNWFDAGRGVSIHLLLGFVGWFGFLLMGVTYKLWSMFLPSRTLPRRARMTGILLHAGIWLGLLSALTDPRWGLRLAWVLIGFAVFGYLLDAVNIWRGRKGRTVDPALAATRVAPLFLVLAALAGVFGALGHPRAWEVAGYWVLNGWVGLSIASFMQKIIPFLLWLHRYAHVHGQGKMPRLSDIFPTLWSWIIVIPWIVGVGLAGTGLWLGAVTVWIGGITLQGIGGVGLLTAVVVALVRDPPRPG